MGRFLFVLGLSFFWVVGCAGKIAEIGEAGTDDASTTTDATTPIDAGACATKCNGKCTDVSADSSNCGACGNACPVASICSAGKCACTANATVCGNACVDTKTNLAHCGKCGNACAMGAMCVNGTCALDCGMKVECNKVCVDTKTDPSNCGMCGNACAMGEQCTLGICCKTGNVVCSGQCVDTKADAKNCGGCGNVCPMNTPVCINGSCSACQLVGTLGNQSFCKVPVNGTMSDTNVRAACLAAGMDVGCSAMGMCQWNDNLCVMTQESSCGNPMLTLAQKLGCNSPVNCNNGVFNGVYQYMGQKWNAGASCGVEGNSWCSNGTNFSNRSALCVK